MAEPIVVKTLQLKRDVGGIYPGYYDTTDLQLWSDGTVTWSRTDRGGVEVPVPGQAALQDLGQSPDTPDLSSIGLIVGADGVRPHQLRPGVPSHSP